MRHILGISAFFHDSAAVLLRDGEIAFAAEEERFTRKKHDASFPRRAAAWCLEAAGIGARDLDLVVYYEKPLRKLDRLLETYLAIAPRGFSSFRQAIPRWVRTKLWIPSEIRRGLGGGYRARIAFAEHHASHAAAAFYPSPFERAVILTCDGVGEWDTTSWGIGEGPRITLRESIAFPHSLGLLYAAFTAFAGFKVNSGEYKLMGLAPYGRPRHADLIRRELIDLKPDGSFRLNQRYFAYCEGLAMTHRRFGDLFGGPARRPESRITERECDLAASVQRVLEDALLAMARDLHARTGIDDLCLAGGVALNCVANGRLRDEGPFSRIWAQPAAGDSGGALGAAMLAWHQWLGRGRDPKRSDAMRGTLLGPAFGDLEVGAAISRRQARAHRLPEGELLARVSELLDRGNVVGWMQGPMELGPRALGARSILADARQVEMKSRLNLKIKLRESFRPFAPVVLREKCHEWFELPPDHDSPYMLFTARVRAERRIEAAGSLETDDLIARSSVPLSSIPAVTHVDGSARVQTVDSERHGRFHRLLRAFYDRTGCPVLTNTSFNVRGEPIVRTPDEALTCFLHTGMDALVIEDHLLLRTEQPPHLLPADVRAHLARFELD